MMNSKEGFNQHNVFFLITFETMMTSVKKKGYGNININKYVVEILKLF